MRDEAFTVNGMQTPRVKRYEQTLRNQLGMLFTLLLFAIAASAVAQDAPPAEPRHDFRYSFRRDRRCRRSTATFACRFRRPRINC